MTDVQETPELKPIIRGKEFSEIRVAKNGSPYLYMSMMCAFDAAWQRALRSAFIFKADRGAYTHTIQVKLLRAMTKGRPEDDNYRLITEIETQNVRVNLNRGSVYYKPSRMTTLALGGMSLPTGMTTEDFKASMIALAQIADEELAQHQAEQTFNRLVANFDKFKRALNA